MFKPMQPEIEKAAQTLRQGGLVAFPTETVYGLGANALMGKAVARIYKAKGRPQFNPLIVHVRTLEDVEALCVMPKSARKLAEAFWPGPLTLVLQRKPDCPVSDLVSAGLETLALRIPAHETAQALLTAARVPIAAPSANRSGHISATQASHVAADLKDRIDHILDGGPTRHGLESTIVAFPDKLRQEPYNEVVLLRAGAIETKALEEVLNHPIKRHPQESGSQPLAPGQLESHYAPKARLRLEAASVSKEEALLAFGKNIPAHEGPCINLSPSGDSIEAAANLFASLRELDAKGVSRIAVMKIPVDGLGEAINDRLRRAAAPRK